MESDRNQLIQTIADYFRDKAEVSAVYIFGSYAHGRPRRTSDVDVGILFEIASADRISLKMDEYLPPIARMLRKDIHFIAMNSANEMLLKQIFSKGRCIAVNNPKHHATFKMTSFTKIAEFGFLKPNMEKGFVRKLAQG